MCRETPTPQSSPNRHISPPSPSNLPSSPQTFKYGPIPPPKSLPNSSNLQIMESLRLEKTSDIPNSNPLPPPLPASLLPHLCLSPTPCHHLAALSKQGFLTSHLQLPPPGAAYGDPTAVTRERRLEAGCFGATPPKVPPLFHTGLQARNPCSRRVSGGGKPRFPPFAGQRSPCHLKQPPRVMTLSLIGILSGFYRDYRCPVAASGPLCHQTRNSNPPPQVSPFNPTVGGGGG